MMLPSLDFLTVVLRERKVRGNGMWCREEDIAPGWMVECRCSVGFVFDKKSRYSDEWNKWLIYECLPEALGCKGVEDERE